jgi:hypothetical protein
MTVVALRRIRDDEQGAGLLAAFIVLFSALTVVGVGILIDSARYFGAGREADAIAMEAARAGANAISPDPLGEGVVVVNPAQAQAAAASAAGAFLARSPFNLGSVSVNGTQVTVSVTSNVDSWFPFMPDRSFTREATAEASAVHGP